MLTRVLVVLPFYGGSLPVGHYCAAALRENGCMVELFDSPAFYGAFGALKGLNIRKERLDFLESSFINVVGDAILAKVERFQPDLVLSMAQAPISPRLLKRLKTDAVPTAMWFVEDYRLFTYWRVFAPLYDLFAVIQKQPFLDELASIGAQNVLYLPLGALPSVHKPVELSELDRMRFDAELSFMGAGYPNRRQAFRQLTGYGLKIWGTEWEGETALAPCLQMQGARVNTEDTVKIFNAARVNLNLHSSIKAEETVPRSDFVNPRTFEIASCGAFQLVDEREYLPELFTPEELATFGSIDELKEKIEYYLAHPEARERIAKRGRERVLRDHTYAARMRALLNFAGERLSGFPKSRAGMAWHKGIPEKLASELSSLMETLTLPADSDFEQVITALRQRSGKLAPLESALLFLDEWQKQYNVE